MKSKTNLNVLNYYTIIEKMITNLNQNFNNFNKKEKANIKL